MIHSHEEFYFANSRLNKENRYFYCTTSQSCYLQVCLRISTAVVISVNYTLKSPREFLGILMPGPDPQRF